MKILNDKNKSSGQIITFHSPKENPGFATVCHKEDSTFVTEGFISVFPFASIKLQITLNSKK